jgi:hypothetical protein
VFVSAKSPGSAPTNRGRADFNGDGKQDLATIMAWANSVAILLGDRKGGFEPGKDAADSLRPYCLARPKGEGYVSHNRPLILLDRWVYCK